MSSEAHDFIVAALTRKARELGFTPVAIDGRQQYIVENRVCIPPAILRHRPDVVGLRADGAFCIAEAKAADDLRSPRTKEQFADFALAVATQAGSRLLIGAPLSAKPQCEHLLDTAGIQTAGNVEALYVPDLLLPREDQV